jgi:hypothetical protein
MTIGNFDWFLHSMLFYHTQMVIKQREKHQSSGQSNEDDDSDISNDNNM